MIVIHGANSAAVEMEPLVEALRPYTKAVALSLPGHGGRPLGEPMTVAAFVRDVIEFMDRESIERTVLLGYSFGGTLALRMAYEHPARVSGVVALAAKSVFDDTTLNHWTRLVQPERLGRPGNPRTPELEKIHAPNAWPDVARANAAFFASLRGAPPVSDAGLAAIRAPVMVVSSNLDQIVPWSESVALAKKLPDAHLAMFYGPAHPLRAIPLLPVARTIGQWLQSKGLQ